MLLGCPLTLSQVLSPLRPPHLLPASMMFATPLNDGLCIVVDSVVTLTPRLSAGQEQRLMQGARHIASTVEMASITREIQASRVCCNSHPKECHPAQMKLKIVCHCSVSSKSVTHERCDLGQAVWADMQVGVVDEVQMVGDPVRGASFTRAVLGLPAKVLHVCGDPAALPLLRLLAMDTGAPSSPQPPMQNKSSTAAQSRHTIGGQQLCCALVEDHLFGEHKFLPTTTRLAGIHGCRVLSSSLRSRCYSPA